MFIDNSRNSENIILPNMVRTLPNTVRFSEPRKHSTRLSYQGTRETEFNFDNEFWDNFEEYLNNIYRKSSVKSRFLYAKKYYGVILNGNAQSLIVYKNRDFILFFL